MPNRLPAWRKRLRQTDTRLFLALPVLMLAVTLAVIRMGGSLLAWARLAGVIALSIVVLIHDDDQRDRAAFAMIVAYTISALTVMDAFSRFLLVGALASATIEVVQLGYYTLSLLGAAYLYRNTDLINAILFTDERTQLLALTSILLLAAATTVAPPLVYVAILIGLPLIVATTAALIAEVIHVGQAVFRPPQ